MDDFGSAQVVYLNTNTCTTEQSLQITTPHNSSHSFVHYYFYAHTAHKRISISDCAGKIFTDIKFKFRDDLKFSFYI